MAGTVEWYTPSWVIDAAVSAFGGPIDLDPASCAEAQSIVRARRWYGIEDDGLSREWDAERLWLNPPYSRGEVDRWIDKLLVEVGSGRTKRAIVLVNTCSSTRWWQRLATASRVLAFPSPRIRFWSPGCEEGGSPRYDSTIALLGRDAESRVRGFVGAFGTAGFVTTGGTV